MKLPIEVNNGVAATPATNSRRDTGIFDPAANRHDTAGNY
jgi:hypothetical protein